MKHLNAPIVTPPEPPKRSNTWIWVTLLVIAVGVILLLALRPKDKKPIVVGKRAAIAAKPPKPKRIFPWYVCNTNHKWAVIDSCEPDGGKDTLWFFYGSESRYYKQVNSQTSGSSGGGNGITISGGSIYWGGSSSEDTTSAAPIGGEFQFSTLDSAKRMYEKYVAKVRREAFVADSTKRRNEFIQDSIFRIDHTYNELENK